MNELHEDYHRAGFGGSLEPGATCALVLVDVCQAYVHEDSPLALDAGASLDALGQLVAGARAGNTMVVFTRVQYQPGGADGGLFFRKVPALSCFVVGDELAEFVDGLSPEPGDTVITKQYPSAFFGTSLASTLHTRGVDTVVIGGFSTSGCVRATALDALCHGFVPIVVRDACADRGTQPHEHNLFDIQAKYGEVVGLGDALDLVGGTTRTPRS